MLVILQAFIAHNIHAQTNKRAVFTYDNNGNRTALNVVMIRVDEEAILNDSIYDRNSSENYTDKGLDTIDCANISIYPNPTCGYLTLTADLHDNTTINVSMLSFGGKLIDHKTMTGQNVEFDMTNLSNGVYFLIIDYQEEKHVWKIIKNN